MIFSIGKQEAKSAEPRVLKTVSLFGATGSIGRSALDVIFSHRDRFQVDVMVGNRNIEALARSAREVGAHHVVTADPKLGDDLKGLLAGTSITSASGPEAVVEAAQRPVDVFLAAIVGASGLSSTFEALSYAKTVALANKECLVCGGNVFMEEARLKGARILPVDSEHSAIFQCLETHHLKSLRKIILTASGGPFRGWSLEQLKKVTVAQALKHPNWSMGPKITIDSATLMNKGLELIEAFFLFPPVALHQLDVVVHPQSIIHSMVSYDDGTTLAQMGVPDMRTPISYALGFPERLSTLVPPLDLIALGTLSFEAVDKHVFRALELARSALSLGGSATAIFNAANEVAVAGFLNKQIGFLTIVEIVEKSLEKALKERMVAPLSDLSGVKQADHYGRAVAKSFL